jgi:hypothetical protein
VEKDTKNKKRKQKLERTATEYGIRYVRGQTITEVLVYFGIWRFRKKSTLKAENGIHAYSGRDKIKTRTNISLSSDVLYVPYAFIKRFGLCKND